MFFLFFSYCEVQTEERNTKEINVKNHRLTFGSTANLFYSLISFACAFFREMRNFSFEEGISKIQIIQFKNQPQLDYDEEFSHSLHFHPYTAQLMRKKNREKFSRSLSCSIEAFLSEHNGNEI